MKNLSYRKRRSAKSMMKKNSENCIGNTEPSHPAVHISGLPSGNYCLVGWDMDTTGRRLIDEICQIAAYTPTSQFAQYIMPYGELNPSSRRRHSLRVVTIGRYRLLKSNKNNKILKTKSEISALTNFISWLEDTKGDASDGVILIFHEPRKIISYMLIEALKRYKLLDRFKDTVKGFANGFALAESKCASMIKTYGLRMLSLVLLESDESLESAVDRSRLAFMVSQNLCQYDHQDLAGCSGDPGHDFKENMIEVVRQYSQLITTEEKEINVLKQLIDRQNTLRPIFGPMLRTSRRDRQHASLLRRILAEGGIDHDMLKAVYATAAKAGLQEQLAKLNFTKKEQQKDLLEILDSYFDPNRTAIFPNSKPRRKIFQVKDIKNKGDDAGDDNKVDNNAQTPDTTTSFPLKDVAPKLVTTSDDVRRNNAQEPILSELSK